MKSKVTQKMAASMTKRQKLIADIYADLLVVSNGKKIK